MYQPTRPYNDDFPTLKEQVKDRVRTLPQVHNPQGVMLMVALNKSPKQKQFSIGKVKMPLLKILFFIEYNLRLTWFRLI
jgi:hypothetical protein